MGIRKILTLSAIMLFLLPGFSTHGRSLPGNLKYVNLFMGTAGDNGQVNPIDEFHTIVGAGGAQGSLDAANMLKPALARGELQCIGATTMDEFAKIIEKDGALDRRFQKIVVEPTDIKQSISILNNIKSNYEEFHKVTYNEEAIEACARLTDRYVTDKFLPDKAIDAMDEAGSMVRLSLTKDKKTGNVVDAEDIATVVSKMTGIPVKLGFTSEALNAFSNRELAPAGLPSE